MAKKIVHYTVHKSQIIRLGDNAIVWPINHPDSSRVSNREPAVTSQVLAYDASTGEFETRNSIYIPRG